MCRALENDRELLQGKLKGSAENVEKLTREMHMQGQDWARELDGLQQQKREVEDRFAKEVQTMEILLEEVEKYASRAKSLEELNQQYK